MRCLVHLCLLGGIAALAACTHLDTDDGSARDATPAPVVATATPEDPIVPIPLSVHVDPRKASLGGQLYRDPILSHDRDVSCITCHPFDKGGADGVAHSKLPGRLPTTVNTPTVFNVGLEYKLHWSAKFDTLEDELDGPLLNSRVMNTNYIEVLGRLEASTVYLQAFRAIFSDGVTEKNLRDVIATYERTLITPNSRFDRYLRGERDAIDDRERAGYEVFKSHGCISCHQGINVGGNLMQRFGAMRDYFSTAKSVEEADTGHYQVTKREEDRYVFRVPSLRNVALTAPYFHDGSADSLGKAVQVMSEYQLGRPVSKEQTDLIVAFLKTLTGELPVEDP